MSEEKNNLQLLTDLKQYILDARSDDTCLGKIEKVLNENVSLKDDIDNLLNGTTLLHRSEFYGLPKISELLRAHGADPKIKDLNGRIPEELKDKGKDINKPKDRTSVRENSAVKPLTGRHSDKSRY